MLTTSRIRPGFITMFYSFSPFCSVLFKWFPYNNISRRTHTFHKSYVRDSTGVHGFPSYTPKMTKYNIVIILMCACFVCTCYCVCVYNNVLVFVCAGYSLYIHLYKYIYIIIIIRLGICAVHYSTSIIVAVAACPGQCDN